MEGNRISALTILNQIGGRLIFCGLLNMVNKNTQYIANALFKYLVGNVDEIFYENCKLSFV
jgi:hypothetical protein